VEYVRIRKAPVQYTDNSYSIMNGIWIVNGSRGHPKKVEWGMKWKDREDTAFTGVKTLIIGNVVYGGNETKQYLFITDASTYGLSSVLFQLPNVPAGTNMSVALRKEMKVIKFISNRLSFAETPFLTTERKAHAILTCLEEVWWLILGSPSATKSILIIWHLLVC